jgi:hypothetical protein
MCPHCKKPHALKESEIPKVKEYLSPIMDENVEDLVFYK